MNSDLLELKSEDINQSAKEIANFIEKSALFYLRTSHNPQKLIEQTLTHTKSTFTWECVASADGFSTLILQKKTSCCGMCHS